MRSETTIMGTFYRWLAWKLPRGLVRWCSVRLMAASSCGSHSDRVVSEITCLDALNNWDGDWDRREKEMFDRMGIFRTIP